jgi:hypothetical protein
MKLAPTTLFSIPPAMTEFATLSRFFARPQLLTPPHREGHLPSLCWLASLAFSPLDRCGGLDASRG